MSTIFLAILISIKFRISWINFIPVDRTPGLVIGVTTLIADPLGEVRAVGPNSTALATAGTGDVLAGILGALLATNADSQPNLLDVAELAVIIHSEAATRAAAAGPVVALDVAEQVRTVIRDWMPA